MGTVSVDLPAHNVRSSSAVGSTLVVTDPECLADPSATTGLTITHPSDFFYVGSADGLGTGTALGFGLFDLPAGATVVDIRFVAHAQRLEPLFDVPPGSWDATVISPVPTTGPSLAVDYNDRRGTSVGHTLGYALTPAGTLSEVVGSPIIHEFDFTDSTPSYDVVIAGVGSPPEGTNGLCPQVVPADAAWWEFPGADHPILLTYLALRVTYAIATSTTRRKYPNPTGLGVGTRRHWPKPRRGVTGIQ